MLSCTFLCVISLGAEGLMNAVSLATCFSMPGGNVQVLSALLIIFLWWTACMSLKYSLQMLLVSGSNGCCLYVAVYCCSCAGECCCLCVCVFVVCGPFPGLLLCTVLLCLKCEYILMVVVLLPCRWWWKFSNVCSAPGRFRRPMAVKKARLELSRVFVWAAVSSGFG